MVKIEKDRVIRDGYLCQRRGARAKDRCFVGEPSRGEVLAVTDRTIAYHEGGKIEVMGRRKLRGREDLSMAYTPGVGS